jgi:hypothetical protein
VILYRTNRWHEAFSPGGAQPPWFVLINVGVTDCWAGHAEWLA